MGRTCRRLITGAVVVCLSTVLMALGVTGQLDPRNTSDEYYDAVNGAQCLEHHVEDGLIPFGFRFSEAYDQLPIGETVNLTVEVWQASNFRNRGIDSPHEIRNITVTVNTEEAPNVQIVTDGLQDPIANGQEVTLTHHDDPFALQDVYIGAEAFEGAFIAEIVDMDPPLHLLGVNGELVLDAHGKVHRSETGEAMVALGKEFFESRGQGNYTFRAGWDSVAPSLDIEVTIKVSLFVNFTQEATEFTFASPDHFLFTRSPPDRTWIEIPVRILSEDEALLDFRIRANTYHPHDPSDRAPLDDGLYYRFLTMRIEGGEEIVPARTIGPTPMGEVVNLYNLLTRLLGFIALFLVVTAMFTGGVFGKISRRAMNRFTGSAKKRVLWHSAIGFLIIVVATLHFVLAIIENRNDVSRGLFWGGIAWVLLLSLGFTGYYQTRIIRRWNYKTWRRVHLWSAVLVLVFVLFHAVLEGSDLKPVKDLMGPWTDRLLWPNPPA